MTYPEWLPTWPSNWPDIVSRYVDTVPRVWPKRLYKRGGKVFADLDKVRMGDPITLFTDDHEFVYIVSEILVVPEVEPMD